MEKLQVDNEYYTLYAPDTLKYITDSMNEILIKKIMYLNSLFGVTSFRKIQINYFDDLKKFRRFVENFRESQENPLPEYATGTYDGGMINAYIDNNLIVGSRLYNSKLYMASHELFHIMYMELILKGNYDKRIVWYDEGMAQLMSGEKDYLLDSKQFKNFINMVIETTKEVPNLNNLSHGSNFQTSNYSGYNLSYIAIRYLWETLSDNDFKELMSDFEKIEKYGESILEEALDYYSSSKEKKKQYIYVACFCKRWFKVN